MKRFAIPAAAIGMVVVAILIGLLFGALTSPSDPFKEEDKRAGADSRDGGDADAVRVPPLFLYVNAGPGANLQVVESEVEMAAGAGVHRYIVKVPLPWTDDFNTVNTAIDMVFRADPKAEVLLDLDLNPPTSWMSDHPEEISSVRAQGFAYPSVASSIWLDEVETRLTRLFKNFEKMPGGERVAGYVLSALERGQWYRSDGYDDSAANTNAFRLWLRERYVDDEVLAKEWGSEDVGLDTANVPHRPNAADSENVFFALPEMRAQVDYLEYVNAATADAIDTLSLHVRKSTPSDFLLYVPYGYLFDSSNGDGGHFALARLLDSDLDGFISPVSYQNRGLGGLGGFMAPVHAALLRGKQWIVMDDTRTGIRQLTGGSGLTRPSGVRIEDLVNIYRRNFGIASMNGIGLAWADPEGTGNLHDREIWKEIESLQELYGDVAFSMASYPEIPVTLLAVLDEESRFYQQCSDPLDAQLYASARDELLRSSVSVKFALLETVLRGEAPRASVYLFLNAHSLSEEERNSIHAILDEHDAAAIWMYAPGYIDKTASVENISATTGMKVRAWKEPTASGSTFAIDGNWLSKGSFIGNGVRWSPLFFVDDPDADVLAYFSGTERTSVAVKFLEDGWSSIFICEPVLPFELLREIISILELPMAAQKKGTSHRDLIHMNNSYLLLHATEPGVRALDLGRRFNVTDVFDPTIGWPQKRLVNITMKSGETRLLHLDPVPGTRDDRDRELEQVPPED